MKQAQGLCDFLKEKLQREMQVHYSATMLHSDIMHIAIRVELREYAHCIQKQPSFEKNQRHKIPQHGKQPTTKKSFSSQRTISLIPSPQFLQEASVAIKQAT